MIRELSWYLENGRFSQTAEELEVSLRRYAEARGGGAKEEDLNALREETRELFEDHCIRSGMRTSETAYVNIDAEFFNGNALDEGAMNGFIKNIIKNHCYQKVLWTYMGTTGLFTDISKTEMKKAGLDYDNYLPLEYKKNRSLKKPLEDAAENGVVIFYQYGDGVVSAEYMPEKAKIRFDRLADTSGVDWKKGYDPNGSVRKDGWYGDYDYTGTWVRVDEKEEGNMPVRRAGVAALELIRDGESAILYDPGLTLLSPPFLLYLTESGEPYGELFPDREQTNKEIDKALKELDVTGISAIGGIAADKPELLAAYREVLGRMALPELQAVEGKNVLKIKEARKREAAAIAEESTGIKLEKKLRIAGQNSGNGDVILSSIAAGSVAVPLSPRKPVDLSALGLSEKEAAELSATPVKTEHEAEYDAALSNLYASWSCYAGAMSRFEAAEFVRGYLEYSDRDKIPAVITAQTTLGEIISGNAGTKKDGVTLYATGIPGVFREPETVDFFDEAAKEKYLKTLERKRVLPKGGSAAALAALQELPKVTGEKKAELNRKLTRALGEYKAISMSTGMPIAEVIDAVKVENAAAMGRKVYYELPVPALIDAAMKENMQKREADLEEAAENREETIIIGGVSGPALDEVLLTREILTAEGMSEEEADKAQSFLHGIRFASENHAAPLFLLETLKENKSKSAKELRKNILKKLDSYEGAAYNLSTDEGLRAYAESSRAKMPVKEVRALLREELKKGGETNVSSVLKVDIKYRDEGEVVPLVRSVPKGSLEKIHLAKSHDRLMEETGYGSNAAELCSFNEETLEKEYGYAVPEAQSATEYLRNIMIPAGKERYFSRDISPVIRSLVQGTNNASVLQDRIAGVLGRGVINASRFPPARSEAVYPGREAVGVHSGAPPETVFFDWGRLAPKTGITDMQRQTNAEYSAVKNDTAVGFLRRGSNAVGSIPAVDFTVSESGDIGRSPIIKFTKRESDTVENIMADSNVTEGLKPVAPFSPKTAHNAELERLLKIEANYEKDKAALARRKQPALARSESHDVGHAEKIENNEDLIKIARLRRKDVIDELRMRKGI
jgi:hypothetical protein